MTNKRASTFINESSTLTFYSVVAYITAYEDSAALHRCIEAIRGQDYPVEKIVIVDNSPTTLLKEVSSDILVWAYPNNVGISGGLSKLIYWARHKGYDFVWMFDQDSEPAPDCLSQLTRAYIKLVVNYPIGIVAPIPLDPRTHRIIEPACFLKDRFRGAQLPVVSRVKEYDSPITSGSLLWLSTLELVAPPDTRLFIDGIDLDYGLRLKRAGYKNFLVPQATMSHNFGSPITIKFLGKKMVVQAYSALRYYYICRNHTYLELKFSRGIYKFTCALRRIKFLSSQIFWLSTMKTENKFQKMWACLRGTYYGFWGDLDQHFYGRNETSPYTGEEADKDGKAKSTKEEEPQ